MHGAHFKHCYSSAQQNINYLKCLDEKHKREGVTYELIDEIGEVKRKGGDWSVAAIRDLDEPDELPGHLYNVFKNIKYDFQVSRARDFRKQVKVFWIQGPSGVGKSNRALDMAEEYENSLLCGTDMITYINGFYLGVRPTSKIAIYDDFRDSHMKPSEFINLIDYNKHWLNIKNGSILNHYNVIIFTSVQRLSKIYRKMYDDEPRLQWERRIEVIDMFPPERVHIGGLPVGYRTEFNELENYEVRTNDDESRVVVDIPPANYYSTRNL